MNKVESLIAEVARARQDYLSLVENVGEEVAALKPADNEWSVTQNTEHLFWAEQGALYGMWKTLYAIRDGKSKRSFESPHKDWPVEKIIEQTWKEKEQVPATAAPRLGGTLRFWCSSLHSLQAILQDFGSDLKEEELRLQAHPHPISGAMDFQQRLEFLLFHIHRHQAQVQSTLNQLQLSA